MEFTGSMFNSIGKLNLQVNESFRLVLPESPLQWVLQIISEQVLQMMFPEKLEHASPSDLKGVSLNG